MHIEQFIKERMYLKGVTEKTVAWYRHSFRAFEGALNDKANIISRIAELRQRGVSAVSINTWLRCLNAYFRWLHVERGQPPLRIPRLKEEQKILATMSEEQVKRIVSAKPSGLNETRAKISAITALDTGMRIQELLNLRRGDVDFDNLVIKVNGKGNKQRLVPMSIELRRVLFRHLGQHQFDRVFCTTRGTSPTQRNLSRDFKSFCSRIGVSGVRISYHTLRHSFAVHYLRSGGNLIYLQRILGHASLEMTNRYTRSLGIEDLQQVHDRLSLLSK
jgi:site-specific recombinase XerD